MTACLEIHKVNKRFGGLVAICDVSLHFPPSCLSAIIGPNGAGKTTLFNLITGRIRADSGRILLNGEDLVGKRPGDIARRGIGRAFQVASLFSTFSVRDSLAAAVLSHRRRLADPFAAFPPADAIERANEVMVLAGLQQHSGRLASSLSHGDQKLLDIALALALEPSVLLLDEPTAGMGRDEARLMMERVQRMWEAEKITLIFIEHDMDIVFGIAQTVHVLRYGALLAEGTPQEVRKHPDVVEAYLGSEH
jgi:branched-chain amino acid transport system ATP-binding protein